MTKLTLALLTWAAGGLGCNQRQSVAPVAPAGPMAVVETSTVEPIRVQDVPLATFVAAVPADDSGGFCSRRPSPNLGRGLRIIQYVFGPEERPRRRLVLWVDSLGQVLRFNDQRGSAVLGPLADSTAGPGTMISYSLDEPGIFARNDRTAIMPGVYRMFGQDALSAPNLGPISAAQERVLRDCVAR
jgi:hypothetical protein